VCCCMNPNINGEVGYRWNDPTAAPGVYPVNAPELGNADILLYDEPGRCGGIDSHSFHYRLVKTCGVYLLVRHGGGDERFRLSYTKSLLDTFAAMNSTARYWMFNAIYHARSDAERESREQEAMRWRTAAAEGRIRTRKQRGENTATVWIVAGRSIQCS
jgi:hypothetical protein